MQWAKYGSFWINCLERFERPHFYPVHNFLYGLQESCTFFLALLRKQLIMQQLH